ncbi:taxadiene 5-alpha hydroxylase-like [Benincasa hispida]|uniref:taxadiene 5-alpha hydroxylase-like n=1 Tax=Benincasa hispida TaxID=102211 RepID=UPI001900C1B8|nr:taxadiene 5-alpha hydroxylase-like [Benincasa hispida]
MITIFLLLITIFLFLRFRTTSSSAATAKNLPPGPLGVPFIGQSLSLLRAMRTNSAEQWLQKRVAKYGPVSKMTLFGKPTVFVHGAAANKAVVFLGEEGTVSNRQIESLKWILGERNLTELSGEDHKRVRGALVWFLRPQTLKSYVGKMDGEVRKHLNMYWHGKKEVTVAPLMKTLTFDIICSLLFGIEEGPTRKSIIQCFKTMVDGIWSVPINLPFTRYNHSLKASAKAQQILKQLLKDKAQKMEEEEEEEKEDDKDLITYLLSIKNKDKEQALSEEEIVHNTILLMIAGHDTTSILLTLMLRVLATNPTVYAAVLQEHEEIARSKESGEALTWEDVSKMKYTWRVAMETLRIYPPVFGGFRVALKDIQLGGYTIPKGWQIFWAAPMTHLDETIFGEPQKFEPSRFDQNQTPIPPFCFIAFGGGPRICPGSEFAKLETLVTIHYLITQFTWKLSCSQDFLTRDPTLMPNKGLPIQISPK